MDEIETSVSDKRSSTWKVDDMMKSISKLESSNHQNYEIIENVAEKLYTK